MASSYAPPSNDISNNPYSGAPPSDEYGNPMAYDYQVPGDNSYDDGIWMSSEILSDGSFIRSSGV